MKFNFSVLFILCVVQIYLLYGCADSQHKTTIGITLFLVQLIFGIMVFVFGRKGKSSVDKFKPPTKILSYLLLGISALLLLLITNWGNNVFQFEKVSIERSDVIPQIDSLSSRFIRRQFPYEIISFGSYSMHPTYMPMQWLPYSLPKLTQTDMRTFAMLMLNGSIFFILFQYIKHKQSLFQIDTFLLILLLIFIPFIIIERDLMVITVEEGIAGYYLLIPVLIVLRKYHWASFMICICLLSRYSIIFWVPLYLFVIFINQPKLALQQLIIICIGFFMMYILPFLMKDPSIFLAGYHHHISATLGEWERMNEQNIPYHLFDGQGFAFLFYQLKNVSALHKLLLLQKVQLAISIGFISLAGIYYYKIRRSVSKELFLISSLAIYMVLFYSFIQLPYKYLFIVPCGLLVSTLLSFQLLKSLETK